LYTRITSWRRGLYGAMVEDVVMALCKAVKRCKGVEVDHWDCEIGVIYLLLLISQDGILRC